MFDQASQADCKHPFIILKDIKSDELESLLSYMYIGEVNVVQEKLSGLIKAAECLRIKGLAVPDEEPSVNSNKLSREKRYSDSSVSSEPKRRRQEDSSFSNYSNKETLSRTNEERRRSNSENSINSKNRNCTSASLSQEESISNRQKSEIEESSQNVKTENSEPEHPEEVVSAKLFINHLMIFIL